MPSLPIKKSKNLPKPHCAKKLVRNPQQSLASRYQIQNKVNISTNLERVVSHLMHKPVEYNMISCLQYQKLLEKKNNIFCN